MDLITDGPPQGRLSIPGGWELVKEYETLKLEKQSRRITQQCACYSYDLQIGEDLPIHEAGLVIQSREISPPLPGLPDTFTEAVFDVASLAAHLTLRNFRHGDRFQPLGMPGHKKVKELFIEKNYRYPSAPVCLFYCSAMRLSGSPDMAEVNSAR